MVSLKELKHVASIVNIGLLLTLCFWNEKNICI